MKRALPITLLVVLLVVFSLVGTKLQEVLPGAGPLPAVFFCVAACVGLRWLWIPMLAWLLSYPLTNIILGFGWDWQMLVTVGGFSLAVGLGFALRKHQRALPLLGGALGAAVLFYLFTNCVSWLLLPDYSKSWSGFVQALWTGAPHHAVATWVFLRNAALANLLFTGLFLLGQRQWGVEPERELAPVRVRR